jgi:hypothetical protein
MGRSATRCKSAPQKIAGPVDLGRLLGHGARLDPETNFSVFGLPALARKEPTRACWPSTI